MTDRPGIQPGPWPPGPATDTLTTSGPYARRTQLGLLESMSFAAGREETSTTGPGEVVSSSHSIVSSRVGAEAEAEAEARASSGKMVSPPVE